MNPYVAIIAQFLAQLTADGYTTESLAQILKHTVIAVTTYLAYRRALYTPVPNSNETKPAAPAGR